MTLEDKTLACRDCSNTFVFTAGEQGFYVEKGLLNEPQRCPAYLAEGLHEAAVSVFVRDPVVGGCALGTPPANIGFRLVADQ